MRTIILIMLLSVSINTNAQYSETSWMFSDDLDSLVAMLGKRHSSLDITIRTINGKERMKLRMVNDTLLLKTDAQGTDTLVFRNNRAETTENNRLAWSCPGKCRPADSSGYSVRYCCSTGDGPATCSREVKDTRGRTIELSFGNSQKKKIKFEYPDSSTTIVHHYSLEKDAEVLQSADTIHTETISAKNSKTIVTREAIRQKYLNSAGYFYFSESTFHAYRYNREKLPVRIQHVTRSTSTGVRKNKMKVVFI